MNRFAPVGPKVEKKWKRKNKVTLKTASSFLSFSFFTTLGPTGANLFLNNSEGIERWLMKSETNRYEKFRVWVVKTCPLRYGNLKFLVETSSIFPQKYRENNRNNVHALNLPLQI